MVLTPKCRRKIIYRQLLVSKPPKISVSSFMGYLKGKSVLTLFDKHANLKYKFGNRYFGVEGYYSRAK